MPGAGTTKELGPNSRAFVLMHLLLHRFQLLRPRAQLTHALLADIYLANRWHGTRLLQLYYLPDGGRGFFAEVGHNEVRDCFVVLRSLSNSEMLADYAHEVRLPEC